MVAGCDGGRAVVSSNEAVCAVSLQFPDAASRETFLLANAESIAKHARTDALRVLATDEPASLLVVLDRPSCDRFSLESEYGLRNADAAAAAFSATPSSEVREALISRLHGSDNEAPHRCVVRFSQTSQDDVGEFFAFMPFVGLSGVSIQGLDGTVYVGANEDCLLSAHMVRAAYAAVHDLPPINLATCENASVDTCN
jgi:hypothetical protein